MDIKSKKYIEIRPNSKLKYFFWSDPFRLPKDDNILNTLSFWQKAKPVIKEYGESLLIAFILAMIIRTFVVQAFKIPTGSMKPTFIE